MKLSARDTRNKRKSIASLFRPPSPKRAPGSIQAIHRRRIFFAILVFAIVVRLWRLGSHSLWLDEFVTYWVVSGDSLTELFRRCYYYQYVSPFYYIFVFYSLKIFGISEIGMRFPSICFFVIASWLIYELVKDMFGTEKEVAWYALLLSAVNPHLIYYSQDARPYMLGIMLTVLSYLLFWRYWRSRERTTLILYGIITIMCVYAHYIFAPFILAQNATYCILSSRKGMGKREFMPWIVCQVLMAISFLPALWHLFRFRIGFSNLTFIPTPSVANIPYFFMPEYLLLGLIIHLCICLIAFGRYAVTIDIDEKEGEACLVLILWFFIPILIIFFLSNIGQGSVFWLRYTLAYLPPVLILLGFFTQRFDPKSSRILLIIILSLGIFGGYSGVNYVKTGLFSHHSKENWKAAINILNDQASPGDPVLMRSGLIEADLPESTTEERLTEYIAAPLSDFYLRVPLNILNLPYSTEKTASASYMEKKYSPSILGSDHLWFLARKSGGENDSEKIIGAIKPLLDNRVIETVNYDFQGVRLYKLCLSEE